MGKVESRECALKSWIEKNGNPNKDWIRIFIFFKTVNDNYSEIRKEFLPAIGEIIRKLEEARILKCFYYLNEPFPKEEFDFKEDKWYNGVLDFRIWIKSKEDCIFFFDKLLKKDVLYYIDRAKIIIESELKKCDKIADYGFWHEPKKHLKFSTDLESKLYYKVICKINESFCKFQIEKRDNKNSKIMGNGFTEPQIIHFFFNTQWIDCLDYFHEKEIDFYLCLAQNKIRIIQESLMEQRKNENDVNMKVNIENGIQYWKKLEKEINTFRERLIKESSQSLITPEY